MTWEYLATTGGAIAVTILITNALRQAFGWRAAWVALVVAFALEALVWLFVAGGTADAAGLALVNVFVVYVGATGGNALVGAAVNRNETRAATSASFWRGWL